MTEPSTPWTARPLKEVVTLQRGFDLPSTDRVDGPFPVISAGVQNGTHTAFKVAGPGFAIGRATNLGQPAWSEVNFWPLNTTLYVKDFHGNNPRWAYYLFRTTDLTGYDSGSVQPMLNRNYIANHPVLVPPVSVQERIVNVLQSLDDKIEANTKLAHTADELASALYLEATQTDFMLSELGDLAEITMGTSPKGETLNESGEGTKFFQGTRDFGFRFPADRVWTTNPTRFAEKHDLLLSVRAPVGTINVARERIAIGRGLAAIRATKDSPNILSTALRNDANAWSHFNSEGTVFGSINKSDLHRIKVKLPTPGAVPELEKQLEGLERSIYHLLVENEHLAVLRDYLLPRLMSGKISVREAEDLGL